VKTFDQITPEQRKKAINSAMYDLVNCISQGTLEAKLTNPRAQAKLESFLSKARKKESPRLAVLHILVDKDVREELTRAAIAAAGGSKYTDDGIAIREEKLCDS
jgi:hypothetical protein